MAKQHILKPTQSNFNTMLANDVTDPKTITNMTMFHHNTNIAFLI